MEKYKPNLDTPSKDSLDKFIKQISSLAYFGDYSKKIDDKTEVQIFIDRDEVGKTNYVFSKITNLGDQKEQRVCETYSVSVEDDSKAGITTSKDIYSLDTPAGLPGLTPEETLLAAINSDRDANMYGLKEIGGLELQEINEILESLAEDNNNFDH